MSEIKQNELLNMYGLDTLLKNGNIKMLRHQDNRMKGFNQLVQDSELLNEYQSYQSKNRFKDCKYIMSYIAFGKTYALFYGLYEVESVQEVSDFKVSENLKNLGHEEKFTGYCYKLKKLDNFKDLENRLVIDWGKSTITWHQWLEKNNKSIIEIRPKGFVKEFPGYLDVVLSYYELSNIVNNIEANRTWYDKLSSVYAIYLILDTKTGNQYIGSASGSNGLWGRWTDYVKTIHGGNKELIELIKKEDESYKLNLQYSILHILSASKSSEVEYYESLYKRKLGSRTFGLNAN